MLMMSFLPRYSAADTGRPSAADGRASVGNGSPALNPCGNGALRSQIGLGFVWPDAPAPRATIEAAVDSSNMTLDLMRTSSSPNHFMTDVYHAMARSSNDRLHR